MRYSIRTLLIVVAIAAAVFGAIELRCLLFRQHCRAQEPAVFASVLRDEMLFGLAAPPDKNDQISYGFLDLRPRNSSSDVPFAIGPSDSWTDPSSEMMVSMEIPGLKPVSSAMDGEIIRYVANVKWLDWSTVRLDFGTVDLGLDVGIALIVENTSGGWQSKRTGTPWNRVLNSGIIESNGR